RADQRAFVREPVDLSLLAEEAVELLLPLAEARGVEVEATGAIAVAAGSHALLLQLATNLVHNAIVHNLPTGGSVLVTTEAGERAAVLRVENTGPLLSPSLVATLTEPFRRGTERIRADHAGVGLGLAIAKSIVGAHDGEIVLTPRADGGLIVTVRLAAP
ncbi:MAG: ATP-binding protein, partial [Microbacterium sp.]